MFGALMNDQQRISWDCRAAQHEDCGHSYGLGRIPVDGKWVSGVYVCLCSCHDSCPIAYNYTPLSTPLTITSVVTRDVWREKCARRGKKEYTSQMLIGPR
jgi:hypothetical protein